MAINWWGAPSKIERLPTYEPDQIAEMQKQLKLGGQEFDPNALEQKATRDYYTKTVPRLTSMFGSAGGGQVSGNMLSALSSSAGELQSNLAAQRSNTALDRLKIGLTPQYEYMYKGEQPGVLPSAAASLVEQGAQALPSAVRAGFDYLTRPGVPEAAGQVGSSALQALTQSKSDFPSPSAPQAGAQSPAIQALAKTGALAKQFGPEAAAAAAPTAVGALRRGAEAAAPIAPTAAGMLAGKAAPGIGAGIKAGLGTAAKFVGIPAALAGLGYGFYQLYRELKGSGRPHSRRRR